MRLWQVGVCGAESEAAGVESALSRFKRLAEKKLRQTFSFPGHQGRFEIRFDALLVGHEMWVYSAAWHPTGTALLTSSMDRSLVIWTIDPSSGVWIDSTRVGDTGGKYIQGFLGALWGPEGKSIIGHGFLGSFRVWNHVGDGALSSGSDSTTGFLNESWEPVPSMTGHFAAAKDACWDPTGSFLLTVGTDQTTRLFAPCIDPSNSTPGFTGICWHELARPQVHGYDMRCITAITPQLFASGADEKVIRVFKAPASFVDALATLSPHAAPDAVVPPVATSEVAAGIAVGASVPTLGLSNKAVMEGEESAGPADRNRVGRADDLSAAGGVFGSATTLPFEPVKLTAAPLEEHLIQNTLWPEVEKLYGHGFELLTLAASPNGEILLSACKATSPEHAVIRVWDTTTWQESYTLPGHTLSVTSIAFSPDGDWVASGSRDRQLCLFYRSDDPDRKYVHGTTVAKAHDRIIWGVSWSHDSAFLASGSRDKRVKIWLRPSENAAADTWTLAPAIDRFSEAVTAVEWCQTLIDGKYAVAVGLESGTIVVLASVDPKIGDWSPIREFSRTECPTDAVHRLRWRPGEHDGQLLAAVSADNSVRLLKIC